MTLALWEKYASKISMILEDYLKCFVHANYRLILLNPQILSKVWQLYEWRSQFHIEYPITNKCKLFFYYSFISTFHWGTEPDENKWFDTSLTFSIWEMDLTEIENSFSSIIKSEFRVFAWKIPSRRIKSWIGSGYFAVKTWTLTDKKNLPIGWQFPNLLCWEMVVWDSYDLEV